MKRRDDRDEEVKPIARQIEQLARAPLYAPRGYRIGDYGNRPPPPEHFRLKVALHFSGVNFVSLNFIDYVSMALCMGDNRVGDTSDLLDLPQEVGLGRRGSF